MCVPCVLTAVRPYACALRADRYEQHLHQLQRALEDAKNQVDQMQKANDELR